MYVRSRRTDVDRLCIAKLLNSAASEVAPLPNVEALDE